MSDRKIYPYLIAFGWLFPIVIPIITIAIKREKYVDSTQHCFLNTEDGVIWAFIAPIIILLLINMVLLILAVVRIMIAKSKSGEEERKKLVLLRNALIYSFILTPILGLPWVILIFNIFIVHTTVEWIFILVNGSMGVVFFLVVVLGNKEVKEIFNRVKEKTSTKSQSHFSSSTNTLASTKFRINRRVKTDDDEVNNFQFSIGELNFSMQTLDILE